MKKWEAYEDYIREHGTRVMAIKKGKALDCTEILCTECGFFPIGECNKKRSNWLYKEYQKNKIKISKATKTVLESLDDKYKWIAKDEAGELMIYEAKPHKKGHVWSIEADSNSSYIDDIFKKELFNFLSWKDEEPTNIKELLENCEVIEDE